MLELIDERLELQGVGVVTHPDDTTCTDRVAIVTGGSRGIGREVTRKLAGRGYAVVVNYARNQGAADAAVEEVVAANGTALTVRGDVADELDVERLFSETTEAFGVSTSSSTPSDRSSLARVPRMTSTRSMRCCGRGLALPTCAAYAASKGAVEAITRVLARELRGRDSTVNAVAPGLKRPGTPAGIANVVAFLVSEAGHRVNGQVIWANGRIV